MRLLTNANHPPAITGISRINGQQRKHKQQSSQSSFATMTQDSLRSSINSFLSERVNLKKKRNHYSTKNHWKILAKRQILKMSSMKLFRVALVLLIVLIISLKNTDRLYYFSLNIVKPIKVSGAQKLYNEGKDQCGIYEANGHNSYVLEKVLYMDPNYHTITFTSTPDNNTDIENAFLLACVVTQRSVDEFKRFFSKIDRLNIKKDEITLAVLFSSTLDTDNSIEKFITNYYNSEKDARISRVVLIYEYPLTGDVSSVKNGKTSAKTLRKFHQEAPISSHKNFLINNALTLEKYIVVIPEFDNFNPESLNSARSELIGVAPKNSNRITIGIDSSLEQLSLQFVFLRSFIFKQGIQFSNILLGGNSWSRKGYVEGDQVEIENLCYQAEAIGYQCDFVGS